MKRIGKCLILVVLLVLTLCPLAYAADNGSFVKEVNSADEKIAQLVSQAQLDAQNASEPEVQKIIKDLRIETRGIISALDQEANEQGITLIHEYYFVEIGGYQVRIDPCRVAGV